MNPIDLMSSSACCVSEQIVGPKPDEWISGRTGPMSALKSAVSAAARTSELSIFFVSYLGVSQHYTKLRR